MIYWWLVFSGSVKSYEICEEGIRSFEIVKSDDEMWEVCVEGQRCSI